METNNKKQSVHSVLAYSYSFTFLVFLFGTLLDLIFKFGFFTHISFVYTGILFMFLGTVVIFWAQRTSRNLKIENLTKETFMGGPYNITRSPTHWGMLFLTLGFGITVNAFFIVLTSIFAFIFSKIFFLRREEKILASKYGAPYLEYKKTVKF